MLLAGASVHAATNGMLAILGSSVPKGVGSSSSTYTNGSLLLGYTGLLTPVVEAMGWAVTNVSTPGDTTALGLSRFGYLTPSAPRVVVLGFSLGNEGLPGSARPEGELEIYRSGMTQLIARCRAINYYPVATLVYAHGQYGPREYEVVRRMNLLMNEWDLPTINLLGALDNGEGQWATGYWTDPAHPNDAGHAEFFHAIVPTLFNAIAAGKTNRPSLAGTTNFVRITRDTGQPAPLLVEPGATVHSFTVNFRVRTTGTGTVAAVGLVSGSTTSFAASVEMRTNQVVYVSTNGQELAFPVPATDGRWHEVALASSYARARTLLQVDGVYAGSVTERWSTAAFVLGGPGSGSSRPAAPAQADYQDWCLYRAPWTRDEGLAQHQGRFQQASLEVAAPLDDPSFPDGGAATNVAQSLTLVRVQGTNLVATAGAEPAGLAGWSFTTGAVSLSWADTVAAETGYAVERRAAEATNAWSQLAVLPAASTQYADSAVSSGSSYVYRVCALVGSLYSEYAGPVAVTVAQDSRTYQDWRNLYFAPAPGTCLIDFNTGSLTNYGGVAWTTVTSLTAAAAYNLVNTNGGSEGYQLFITDGFDTFRTNNGNPLVEWATNAQSSLFVSTNDGVGEVTLSGLNDRGLYDLLLYGRRGTGVAGFDYRTVYVVAGAEPYARAEVQTLTNPAALLIPGVRSRGGRIVVQVSGVDAPAGTAFAGLSFLALESYRAEDSFLVDFNPNAQATVEGGPAWNTVTSPTNPAPYDLQDASGRTDAGYTLVVTNKFTGFRDNNLGACNGFSCLAEDTLYYGPGKLVFGGLDTNRSYTFTFLARRGTVTGGFDYSGLYLFEGGGATVTSVVDGATNLYCTRVGGLTPDAAGRITLTVATNPAGVAGTDFPVLNFIRMTRSAVTSTYAGGTADDPDGDGLPNYAEYGLGLHPTNADAQAFALDEVGVGNTSATLVAYYRSSPAARQAEFVLETTTNLLDPGWQSDATASQVVITVTATGQTLAVQRPVSEALQFARVGVRLAGTTGAVYYAQPAGYQRLSLGEGRNFIAASFGGLTTPLGVLLGTRQLPRGETESTATAMDRWDRSAQTLTNRYWLSSAPGFEGWRRPSFETADSLSVDTREGLIVTVRAGQGTPPLVLAGPIRTNRVETTLPANGYAVVASAYPAEISLAQSRLVESGWVGGDSLVTSDNLIFHNRTNDQFEVKLWYDTFSGTWRNADASAATRTILPGESFLVRRRNRPTSMVWTQAPPFSLP